MNVAFFITFVAVIAVAATESVPVPPNKSGCSDISQIFTPFSVRKQVCGSDNETYMNVNYLNYMNCLKKQNVTVVKEGYCDEEEGRRAEEAHRKSMAEYAKQIRKAMKEGRPIPYRADHPMPNLDDYPEED